MRKYPRPKIKMIKITKTCLLRIAAPSILLVQKTAFGRIFNYSITTHTLPFDGKKMNVYIIVFKKLNIKIIIK